MNKFVERAWAIEDKKRGYTVYRGTKPDYIKTKWVTGSLKDALWVIAMSLVIGMILGLAITK